MISTNGMTTLAYLSKNLISVQTFDYLQVILNTAGVAFDVTNGLGQASNTSSEVLLDMGGFDAQKCTCILQFPSPTTAGTEDLGVLLGVINSGKAGQESYIEARVSTGNARIATMVGGTLVNQSSTAWSVAQGVLMTISVQRIGSLVTANFHAASGPGDVQLTYTLPGGSTLVTGGVMGFRSSSKAVWCSSIIGEQLA